MLRLLVPLIIFSVCTSPAFAEFNTVSCNVNNILVETKNSGDCKNIGGEALKNYMFVINFDTGSFEKGKLRLNGNGTSNVIYFTDRPERKSGHMSVIKFKSIWARGINSFKSDPPNATLSVIVGGKDKNSVMVISNPEIYQNSIEFDVIKIDGEPPSAFKTGGLFIDPLQLKYDN